MGYSPWGCKESDMTERFVKTLLKNKTKQNKKNFIKNIGLKVSMNITGFSFTSSVGCSVVSDSVIP